MRARLPSLRFVGRGDTGVRRMALTTASLVVWIYLYLVMLLAGWVAVSSLVGGWDPVVITSGSMAPTMRSGDILMVDEHPTDEVLGQGAVVVIERDGGERVAHRIFEVVNDSYITKGDANAVPDVGDVSAEDAVGVGRLVIPLIGLPISWAQDGDLIPLIGWAIATLAAIAYAVGTTLRRLQSDQAQLERPANAMTRAGVRRLRGLVATMVGLQFVIDPGQFEVAGAAVARWAVPLATIALLSTVNGLTGHEDEPERLQLSGLGALTIDTLVVIMLATTLSGSSIAWILFALPIIEAAIGFGITGALVHWFALTSITLASRIWVSEIGGSNSSELIGELELVLDQLSILFLVVIPGAYLAEQLLIDVRSQEQATEAAQGRSALLETIVEAGHEVNRIGGQNVKALVDAAIDLGFENADVVLVEPDDEFRILASRATARTVLPQPGEAGSGLTADDLVHDTVIVDEMDPAPAEVSALRAAGLTAMVATLVRAVDARRVVLRVGSTASESLSTDRLDAVRLLAAQAGVALTNDELVGELRGMRDEMSHRARHDALTGLPNRAGLRPALTRALEESTSRSRPAVMFLDLNGFKPVNDRLGHEVGDELLRQIAQRLQRLVVEPDFVSRLGGDEFVIVLHDGNDEAIRSTIDLVDRLFTEPFALTAGKVSVGAAIGYAVADDDMHASELLRRADVAMYEAKRTRTSAIGYDRTLDAPRRRRNAVASEIERALEDHSIELLYQPIVHAPSMRIVGLEALVRWEHPSHGPIPPPVLIDAAHDAGLGRQLNKWIIDTAIGRAREWGFGRDSTLFMTVNASAEELDYPWVAGNVLDAIERENVPTTAIWVELSEGLVRDPLPVASSNIEALRARGVQLLLDDFGEGQTSLSHLSRLPIGGVKLGRHFVVNCLDSEADRIVLSSVIELSTRLGFVVIAEGIETEEQYQAVTTGGCQLLQGYRLYRPLTASQVAPVIEAQARSEARAQAEVNR